LAACCWSLLAAAARLLAAGGCRRLLAADGCQRLLLGGRLTVGGPRWPQGWSGF